MVSDAVARPTVSVEIIQHLGITAWLIMALDLGAITVVANCSVLSKGDDRFLVGFSSFWVLE